MEDEQYEAIIVNPDLRENEIVHAVNGSNIGVMELGKRLLLAAKEGNTDSVRNLMKGGAPFATDWVDNLVIFVTVGPFLAVLCSNAEYTVNVLTLGTGGVLLTYVTVSSQVAVYKFKRLIKKLKLGTTSLHAAAAGGHLETCELLLRSGILKDARTKVEKTPLHMACQEGHCEVALLLLANGADVNAQDMLQMTPLHWAVEREQIGTIKVLLQNGADPALVNKFDKTCYDIANDAERHDIVELLQNEPRKGEYTVVGKKKSNFQLKTPARILTTKSPSKPFEIVNGSVNKNLERPKTAIILPTYQNKKPGVTIKKLKSTSDEEQSRLATLQLLEEHGIEMLEGEDINLVASAVGSGQTVVLTEAGKQALSLTAEKVQKAKPLKRPNPEISVEITSKNSVSINSIDKSNVEKGRPRKKFIKIDKSPTIQQFDPSIEEINKKLEEAKREAEQYKELYAKKQREAEEYRSKLETITMSVCKAELQEVKEAEEDEEEEEEAEDLDDYEEVE